MKLEEFLSGLDPKLARGIKTAAETEVEILPTASYGVNRILGGGVAKGRIAIFYGNQSSGKTLLAQQSVAKWQKEGLVCAWVDAENAWDKRWAEKLGVNNEELILVQEQSAAKIEEKVFPLLRAGIDVIVVDSISDIMPETFIDNDGNLTESRIRIGAHAQTVTKMLNGMLYENDNTAIILISQTTTKMEKTHTAQVPHGGNKLLFAGSQMLKLTSSNSISSQIKGDVAIGDLIIEETIGRPVEAYAEKNKLGKQAGKCKYNIYYAGPNLGIDYVGEIVDEAIRLAIIKKSSTWFVYDDERKWQGDKKTAKALREDPKLLKEIEDKIAETLAQ